MTTLPDTISVEVPMYYGLTIEDLMPDKAAIGHPTKDAVKFLQDLDREELTRVLTMAVMLYHKRSGLFTMGECIETASIWERG